jgi:hypothetical protein
VQMGMRTGGAGRAAGLRNVVSWWGYQRLRSRQDKKGTGSFEGGTSIWNRPRGNQLQLADIAVASRSIAKSQFSRNARDVVHLDYHPDGGVVIARGAAPVHLHDGAEGQEGQAKEVLMPVGQGKPEDG